MSGGGGRCFLCEAACDALCEACGLVYFCCDDHRDLGGDSKKAQLPSFLSMLDK